MPVIPEEFTESVKTKAGSQHRCKGTVGWAQQLSEGTTLLAHFNPSSPGEMDAVSDRSCPWAIKAGAWIYSHLDLPSNYSSATFNRVLSGSSQLPELQFPICAKEI